LTTQATQFSGSSSEKPISTEALNSAVQGSYGDITDLGNQPVDYLDLIQRFMKTQSRDLGTAFSMEGSRSESGTPNAYPKGGYELSKMTSIWYDEKASKYIKPPYLASILSNLEKTITKAGEPEASPYVNEILLNIRQLDDLIPFDPIMDFLMPFHDSLAHESRWVDYSNDQYEKAYSILSKLISANNLTQKDINIAVVKLKKLGFDIIPFSL